MLTASQRALYGDACSPRDIAVAVAVMARGNLQASYYRARYYDQTVGRFLSEDPMGFVSTVDFYTYVRNKAVSFVDPRGMQKIGKSPLDPNQNTIVCNGSGGIRPHIGDHDKFGPDEKCLEQCMIAHEEMHIGYVLGVNPTVCFGEKDGTKVVPRSPKEGAEGEISGSNVELACLQNLKTKIQKEPCPSCSPKAVDKRIEQIRRYRALNEAILWSLE